MSSPPPSPPRPYNVALNFATHAFTDLREYTADTLTDAIDVTEALTASKYHAPEAAAAAYAAAVAASEDTSLNSKVCLSAAAFAKTLLKAVKLLVQRRVELVAFYNTETEQEWLPDRAPVGEPRAYKKPKTCGMLLTKAYPLDDAYKLNLRNHTVYWNVVKRLKHGVATTTAFIDELTAANDVLTTDVYPLAGTSAFYTSHKSATRGVRNAGFVRTAAGDDFSRGTVRECLHDSVSCLLDNVNGQGAAEHKRDLLAVVPVEKATDASFAKMTAALADVGIRFDRVSKMFTKKKWGPALALLNVREGKFVVQIAVNYPPGDPRLLSDPTPDRHCLAYDGTKLQDNNGRWPVVLVEEADRETPAAARAVFDSFYPGLKVVVQNVYQIVV